MRWTVTYRPSAEKDLAKLWLGATDRQAVADAADSIDRQLSSHPLQAGESRQEGSRILIEAPLAVLYDVSTEDQLVSVWAVFQWE